MLLSADLHYAALRDAEQGLVAKDVAVNPNTAETLLVLVLLRALVGDSLSNISRLATSPYQLQPLERRRRRCVGISTTLCHGEGRQRLLPLGLEESWEFDLLQL